MAVVLQRELLIALFPVFDVQRMRFSPIDLAVTTRWLGQTWLASRNSDNWPLHRVTLEPVSAKVKPSPWNQWFLQRKHVFP